jgi:hypothetical protein
MDSWIGIAAVIFALAAVAAWVLARQKKAAVEDFGESRVVAKAASNAPAQATVSDLARLLLEEASRQTGIDLSRDPMAMTRLNEAARKAVDDLREARDVEVNLPYLAADRSGPKHFIAKVERDSMGRLVLR